MSAPTGSAPVSPFLAFVSPQDRTRCGSASGWPWGCRWRSSASSSSGAVAHAARTRPARPRAHGRSPARTGCWRNAGLLGVQAFVVLAFALPLLGAARLAFQRPAWTFVSPARPFASKLLAAGADHLCRADRRRIAVDVAQGARLVPPVLNRASPRPTASPTAWPLPLTLLMAAARGVGVPRRAAAGHGGLHPDPHRALRRQRPAVRPCPAPVRPIRSSSSTSPSSAGCSPIRCWSSAASSSAWAPGFANNLLLLAAGPRRPRPAPALPLDRPRHGRDLDRSGRTGRDGAGHRRRRPPDQAPAEEV